MIELKSIYRDEMNQEYEQNCDLVAIRNTKSKSICYMTGHTFFEDLYDIKSIIKSGLSQDNASQPTQILEKDQYFIRKAYVIVTSQIPAS